MIKKLVILGSFALMLYGKGTEGIATSAYPDLYPALTKDSKGILYCTYEHARLAEDHDIIVAVKLLPDQPWIAMGTWLYAVTTDNRKPSIAVGRRDTIYVVCEGPDPSEEVKGNFHWYVSADTAKRWVTWYLKDSEWWLKCTYPGVAADKTGNKWIVFQDNQDPNNPNIRGYHIVGNALYELQIAKTPELEKNPVIAAGDDFAIVVYERGIKPQRDLWAVKIKGHTVSPPVIVSAFPDKDERAPYISIHRNNVYVGFTANDDVWLAISKDGGSSFDVVPVDTTKDKTRWIAVVGKEENIHAAYWHESKNIYYVVSTNYGLHWSKPQIVTDRNTAVDTPRVCIIDPSNPYIAWVDNRRYNLDICGSPAPPVGIEEEQETLTETPEATVFKNCFSFSYELKGNSFVNIEIFNINGQKVITLVKGNKSQGKYTVRWDGKDSQGFKQPSGVYFIRIIKEGKIKTFPVIYLR